MPILILAEYSNEKLQPSVQNLVEAAKQLGDEITILLAGENIDSIVQQAAKIAGVNTVLYANNQSYKHQLAENVAQLVENVASSYEYIIAPASTFGKNLLPRIAGLLDVGQVSDVTKIIDANTFEHPIYAGNAIETVKVLSDKKLLTIRTTAFNAVTGEQPASPIENLDFVYNYDRVNFVNHESVQSKRPELSNAEIIVSGGRGLQSLEKFKIIEELADVFGAAIGASRAAVDAGFVPNDYQVGQTGKVVAPKLYFAIGISGAIQHIAGMKDSKIIVAINKDTDAPIFQIATYGLVGDLFTIVPELVDKLKQRLK